MIKIEQSNVVGIDEMEHNTIFMDNNQRMCVKEGSQHRLFHGDYMYSNDLPSVRYACTPIARLIERGGMPVLESLNDPKVTECKLPVGGIYSVGPILFCALSGDAHGKTCLSLTDYSVGGRDTIKYSLRARLAFDSAPIENKTFKIGDWELVVEKAIESCLCCGQRINKKKYGEMVVGDIFLGGGKEYFRTTGGIVSTQDLKFHSEPLVVMDTVIHLGHISARKAVV